MGVWTGVNYVIGNKKKGDNMCFNCGDPTHEEIKEWKPVFCTLCEYWKYDVLPEQPSSDRCFHPDICNHKEWVEPNPVREGYWNEWIASGNCWRLNSYNDCELFKRMEYPDRSEMK